MQDHEPGDTSITPRVRIARRLLLYQKTSSSIFIALLMLLLFGLVTAFLVFGSSNTSKGLWIAVVSVFAVVTIAGIVAKVFWPRWMFADAFRVARERGGLVCPFDGAPMLPETIRGYPHRFVRCPSCGRIGGEANMQTFWSSYRKAETISMDDLLVGADLEVSWWKPAKFICPFDEGSLTPLGDEPPEVFLGVCDRCYEVIPLRMAVRHRQMHDTDGAGATRILKKSVRRVVVRLPASE